MNVLLIGSTQTAEDVAATFEARGHTVYFCADSQEGMQVLDREEPPLAVLAHPAVDGAFMEMVRCFTSGARVSNGTSGPLLVAFLNRAEPADLQTLMEGGVEDAVLFSERDPIRPYRLSVIEGRAVARAEAQAAHRQRMELLHHFVENTPAAVAMFDRDMRYLVCSKRWMVDYRLGDQDLRGRNHYEVFPEVPEQWRAIHARCLEGAIERCEEEAFRRQDGSIDWVRWEVRPWMNRAGEIGGVIMFTEVLTRRKTAEQAFKDIDLRARALFEYSPNAILIYDATDCRYVDANSKAESLFGMSHGELVASKLFFGPTDNKEVPSSEEEIQRAAQIQAALSGQAPSFEWTYRRPDGRDIPCEVRLVPLPQTERRLILCSVLDISRRKADEEELRRSAREFRHLFDNAHDPGFLCDPVRGVILEANRRASEVYGYAHEELLGKPLDMLEADDLHEERTLMDLLEAGECDGEEMIHTTKSGERVFVEVNAESVRYQGRPAVLLIHRDVTERRRTEERLRVSQKMEAIGNLAGGVAHDFNNLLLTINGNTELLLAKLTLDCKEREYAEEVLMAAQRASDLTRQLLAFGRRQMLMPKVLDLNDLVSQSLKMLRRVIPESILISTRASPDLGSIKADPVQIDQIILNLALNARDAMPRGGELIITTANVELGSSMPGQVVQIKPGPYIMLAVSDSGEGIAPEIQERVFEPFFTTKKMGQGTGLGLSTVYSVVKQSGGYIFLESYPGEGTTFRIYLPRVAAKSSRDARRTSQIVFIRGTETILIAEDEDSVRNLAKEVLVLNGYTVLEAANGHEALKVAETYEGRIDMLMTDMIMPRMGGGELADLMRERQRDLKVLFTSGYAEEALAPQDLQNRGDGYLQKPYGLERLVQKVRKILDDAPDAGHTADAGRS